MTPEGREPVADVHDHPSAVRSRTSGRASRPPVPLLTRLNQHGFRLLQVADALVLFGTLMATSWIRFWVLPDPADRGWPVGPAGAYEGRNYLMAFAVAVAVHLAVYYFGGLYERGPRLGYPPALPRVVPRSLAAVLIIALIGYITSGAGGRFFPTPSVHLGVLLVVGSIAVAANRRLVHWVRLNREGPPRVLLVGAPDEVNVAREHIRDDIDRVVEVGAVSNPDSILEEVERVKASDVVLLSSRWLDDLYPAVINRLERHGITVLQRVTAKETLFGIERVRQVGGMPFLLLRSQTLPQSRARFKRAFELSILLVASPVLVPLVGLVALYQLVVAGRPLLFWQERVGQGGKTFQMVKFRTMYPNAEEDGNPRLATQDDPRIIPACRWIRAMRLDELPQVWNVVRGEMSLVGPRPERPMLTAQFEEVIPGYSRRYEIPPGITGLAQVHGRYDTDPEYKLGYDVQYLVNWTPILDLEILVRTMWVVLARRI